MTSLPEPLSPRKRTVTSFGRDARDESSTRCIAGLSATMRPTERRLGAQTCILQTKRARLDGALHREDELVGIEGLRQVVERAGLHRGDRDALRAVRGQHEHRHARVLRAHAPRGRCMPSIGCIARSVMTTSAPRASNAASPAAPAVGRLDRRGPASLEHRLEREAQRGVVVDHQNARAWGWRSLANGAPQARSADRRHRRAERLRPAVRPSAAARS